MKVFLIDDPKIRRFLRSGPHIVGCLSLLTATLLLLSGCSERKAQAVIEETVPVTVATAVQKTIPVQVRAIGTGEAYSTVSVRSQVEGEVLRVYFQEGQDVKKGDLLFSIDPRPFEATRKQAEANLARDIAQEKNARAQAERYTKLFQAGIVSKEQYDQFRTNADALQAAVRADKAAVENAKVQLGYCSIHSPIDGQTGSLLVHQGNLVKSNDTTLVVINQISPLYVDFSVPEQYLSQIKKYNAARPLQVDAIIPNDEGRPARGVLSFVDNAVDRTTGTIRLKGTFPNRDKRLWPGQFANVVLTLTAQSNMLVVPSQAVQTGQKGQYVFVIKPNLIAEPRPVVADSTAEGEAVIRKGLQLGEKVVTDGQLRLFLGARVEVKKSPEGSQGGGS